MVSITNFPKDFLEALVGKGRIALNSVFKQSSGSLKQCIRIYFEFVKEDELDY